MLLVVCRSDKLIVFSCLLSVCVFFASNVFLISWQEPSNHFNIFLFIRCQLGMSLGHCLAESQDQQHGNSGTCTLRYHVFSFIARYMNILAFFAISGIHFGYVEAQGETILVLWEHWYFILYCLVMCCFCFHQWLKAWPLWWFKIWSLLNLHFSGSTWETLAI